MPLVAGLVDELAAAGIAAFGPTADAARLEGSKAYAKEVMRDAGVPTGAASRVEDVDAGLAAIDAYPTVIKADGLAGGKGVVIAEDEDAARAALETDAVAAASKQQVSAIESLNAAATQLRAMAQDHSWDRAASQYEALYRGS
jgi:phosphoribosylamine-glycine ligase